MDYLEYLKIPYKLRGRSNSGVDCLGLVMLFYKQTLNIILPDYTEYAKRWFISDAKKIIKQYHTFGFIKVTSYQYGDVLLLNDSGYPKHLAVCVENGYMLHTLETGTCCHSYVQGSWNSKVHSIYRFKGAQDASTLS